MGRLRMAMVVESTMNIRRIKDSLIKGQHASGDCHVHRNLCGHPADQHLSVAGLTVMRRVVDRFPSPQLVLGQIWKRFAISARNKKITFQFLLKSLVTIGVISVISYHTVTPTDRQRIERATHRYLVTISFDLFSSSVEQNRFSGLVTLKKCLARPS